MAIIVLLQSQVNAENSMIIYYDFTTYFFKTHFHMKNSKLIKKDKGRRRKCKIGWWIFLRIKRITCLQ